MNLLPKNPIRWVAVICVTVIACFIMWMDWRTSNILSSPSWCSKAVQAERITPGNSFQGLTGCIDILKIQLKAVATDSHIRVLVEALCLLTLIVIVIAKGKLDLDLPDKLGGGGVHLGRNEQTPEEKGATKVAAAAVAAKDQVSEQAHGVGTGGEDG